MGLTLNLPTRDGSLQINNQGQLVTNDGLPVMGGNGPVTFQRGDQDISIARDGTITVREGNNVNIDSVRGKLRPNVPSLNDNIDTLKKFSVEACRSKFAVAADVARKYNILPVNKTGATITIAMAGRCPALPSISTPACCRCGRINQDRSALSDRLLTSLTDRVKS